MYYFKLGFLLSEILILNLSTSRRDELAFYSILPKLEGKLQQKLGLGFPEAIYSSLFPCLL